MQRYFVEDKNNNQFILSQSDSFHVSRVMRMKKGDQIISYEEYSFILKSFGLSLR